MSITPDQKQQITSLLEIKIVNKLARYSRETTSMPFLSRLMQDNEKVASYSFIHSLVTTLGMSIYEDVSKIVATPLSEECFTHYGVGGVISPDQAGVINHICRELRNQERQPDIQRETKEVLKASAENGKFQKEGNVADLYLKRKGVEHYFEIKTVKPNIDVFAKSKHKLLEWIARRRADVKVYLAFPYNPYAPQPYNRFTQQNMMDHPNDFLVGEEYWDYLGGSGTLSAILDIFNTVGKKYQKQINEKISQIANDKIDSY